MKNSMTDCFHNANQCHMLNAFRGSSFLGGDSSTRPGQYLLPIFEPHEISHFVTGRPIECRSGILRIEDDGNTYDVG